MRRYFHTVLILLLLSFFAGCSKKSDEYKIGVLVGLSGNYNTLGSQLRDGIALAFDEIDYTLDGKFIKLVIKDDKQNVNEDKKMLQQLLKEGVKIIIGNSTSSMTKVTLESIKNNSDILLFSPTSSSDIFSDKDDNLIRLRGDFDSKSIVQFIEKKELKNIALIGDNRNRAFLYNYRVLLKKKLEKKGIRYTKFIDSNENIKKILKELNVTPYDTIILLANSKNTAKIVQYLRTNNIEVPIISSAWSMSNTFLQNIGKYSQDLYFMAEENKDDNEASHLNFEKKFTKVYKRKPLKFHLDGYLAAKILIQAIKITGDFDTKKIKQYIVSHTFIIDGIHYNFTKFGDLQKKKMIFIIKNNQFVKLK